VTRDKDRVGVKTPSVEHVPIKGPAWEGEGLGLRFLRGWGAMGSWTRGPEPRCTPWVRLHHGPIDRSNLNVLWV